MAYSSIRKEVGENETKWKIFSLRNDKLVLCETLLLVNLVLHENVN